MQTAGGPGDPGRDGDRVRARAPPRSAATRRSSAGSPSAFLAASLVFRTVATGHGPFANMYEFSVAFAFGIITAYMWFERKYHQRILALVALPVALAMMVYAWSIQGPHRAARARPPEQHAADRPRGRRDRRLRLLRHRLRRPRSCSCSRARASSSITARPRRDRARRRRRWRSADGAPAPSAAALVSRSSCTVGVPPWPSGPSGAGSTPTSWPATSGGRWGLPKPQVLDEIGYRAVVVGFPFLTLTIILGAVWAETAWGTYWSWDPKETASLRHLVHLRRLPPRPRDARLARRAGGLAPGPRLHRHRCSPTSAT